MSKLRRQRATSRAQVADAAPEEPRPAPAIIDQAPRPRPICRNCRRHLRPAQVANIAMGGCPYLAAWPRLVAADWCPEYQAPPGTLEKAKERARGLLAAAWEKVMGRSAA